MGRAVGCTYTSSVDMPHSMLERRDFQTTLSILNCGLHEWSNNWVIILRPKHENPVRRVAGQCLQKRRMSNQLAKLRYTNTHLVVKVDNEWGSWRWKTYYTITGYIQLSPVPCHENTINHWGKVTTLWSNLSFEWHDTLGCSYKV